MVKKAESKTVSPKVTSALEKKPAKRRTMYSADPEQADARTPKSQRMGALINRAMLARGFHASELAREASLYMPEEYRQKQTAAGKEVFGRWLVTNYIRGYNMPNQMHLDALAKALRVPVESLIPDGEATVTARRADVRRMEMDGSGRAHIVLDMWVSEETGLKIMALLRAE